MMPFQLARALLLLLLPFVIASQEDEGPLVTVAQGTLRGLRVDRSPTSTLRTLYSFRGIPYARPPVGQFRFKDPVEAVPWTGTRNATAYGSACIQKNLASLNVSGEEDCLFLNVYTADPPETWPNVRRPVILMIHGGAFVQWKGDMEATRPDSVLRKGVLLVSINYRLGVMGFLNTKDSQAPGNAGLKDQTMALRWVQKNIAAFGGDPNKVTIIGESAGGASVHLHMLSPLSRGLFHRAISVSGSALPSWARADQPRRNALAMRRHFANQCSDLSEDAIVPCLQRIDAKELVSKQFETPREQYQYYFLKNRFLPSVEAASASSAPFLPAEPEQLMMEGRFARVPYMTGFVSAEGIQWLAFAGLLDNPSQYAEVDEHFEDILRCEMPPGKRTREVAREVRQFYLGDRSLRNANEDLETLAMFERLCTDFSIRGGTLKSAQLMADHGGTVFVYEFSRDGPIGFIKQAYNVTNIPGVMHGDDMVYVYDFTDDDGLQPIPKSEVPIRDRQATIITNMAKTGNPTPDGSNLLHWPTYNPQQPKYMDMNIELSVRDIQQDWMHIWDNTPMTGGHS